MSAVLSEQPRGELRLDVPAEDYYRRELDVARASGLGVLLEKSPAHYRAWVEAQEEHDTPAQVFGRAYHCRVLEPERFAQTYVAEPQDAPRRPSVTQRKAKKPSPDTVAAIAFWDAWEAENAGRIVLPAEAFDVIEAMHRTLVAHPVVRGLMKDGHSEVTLQWVDGETGVRCKARADWWSPQRRLLADLKTTDDASPEGFRRSIARYGYHLQHAHYCDGAQAAGVPVRNYLILAQEKEPPYAVAVYHIDAAAETRGYELRQRGLRVMRECIDRGEWPAYGAGITEITLPAWALQD